MTSLDATTEARLEQLEHLLATFPESVAPISYALTGPPPLEPLGVLLTSAPSPSPVLGRFVKRLKAARPDLTEGALLALQVPVAAGDQEVYLARLGKWQFEQTLLKRELGQVLGE